jgi:hypothetical protein
MGPSTNRPVTQWSKGEYTDANNKQDDVAMISSYIPYIPDDYGNTTATAAHMFSGTIRRGLISDAADVDTFRIFADIGELTVNVLVVPNWVKEPAWQTFPLATCRANLDVQLQLLDATAAVLATVNPTAVDNVSCPHMPASLSYNITTPGAYFLAVQGSGFLNATHGYTSYGSIGAYAITVLYAPGRPPSPPPPAPPPPPRGPPPPRRRPAGASARRPTAAATAAWPARR